MLNLEQVTKELKKWEFPYRNNVVPGHSTYKVKWVLPAGPATMIASEKVSSYLFGFDLRGITIFLADDKWNILDRLLLEWKDIQKFQIRKGLLENTMNILTEELDLSLKVSKIVAGNPWVKENIAHLETFHYYARP